MPTLSLIHKLAAAYRSRRSRRQLRRETTRLARTDGLFFSRDPVKQKADGWAAHLSEWTDRPGVQMLEIGSLEGRSAIWFCQNILTGDGSR